MYVSNETRRPQISVNECTFVTSGPRATDTKCANRVCLCRPPGRGGRSAPARLSGHMLRFSRFSRRRLEACMCLCSWPAAAHSGLPRWRSCGNLPPLLPSRDYHTDRGSV